MAKRIHKNINKMGCKMPAFVHSLLGVSRRFPHTVSVVHVYVHVHVHNIPINIYIYYMHANYTYIVFAFFAHGCSFLMALLPKWLFRAQGTLC